MVLLFQNTVGEQYAKAYSKPPYKTHLLLDFDTLNQRNNTFFRHNLFKLSIYLLRFWIIIPIYII